MPSTSRFERSVPPMTRYGERWVDFSRRPIWHVRGVDRSGANDFSVGHEPAAAAGTAGAPEGLA